MGLLVVVSACMSLDLSLNLCISSQPEAEGEGDVPGHVWWGRLARSTFA